MAEDEKKETENTNPEPKKKKRTLFHKIVNVFLYFILGILILFLIVIGITQTSTFREFARKTVLEEVNSTLNGKLYIEKLEGTIFTSLILRNTSLTLDKDTILKAGVIEVRTSPLQLLLKRISVRKVEIRDAEINLITESNGELNLSRIAPPTPEDTTTSEFPFTILVRDLSLRNVSFSHRRYDVPLTNTLYDSLYFNDFKIKDLKLSLTAFADIKNNNYELSISDFSLNTNIRDFGIKNISGDFEVNKDGVHASGFNLKTLRSDVSISASLADYNLFDSTANISNALLELDVEGDKFHFADLKTFVPSMDIINDGIFFKLTSSGSLKELEISTVEVEYQSTRLALSGKLIDLDEPSRMFISVHSDEAYVKVSDINNLMPSIKLPEEYNQVGVVRFDTLHYDGSTDNFKTHLYARTDIGNLFAQGILDFRNPEMGYDLTFRTYNFNLSPFIGMKSEINSIGEAKGKGTELNTIDAVIDFSANGTFEGNRISELSLKSDAGNGVINYDLSAVSDTAKAHFKGFIDFSDQDKPSYEINGLAENINIASYTGDTSFASNLNFDLQAAGESFDLENINLFLNLNVFNSILNEKKIDSTRAIVDLQKENGKRVINIISDLADISITGNYSLDKSIDLINKEIDIISRTISERVNKFIPAQDTLISSTVDLASDDFKEFTTEEDSITRIKYLIDLKDFELATLFLGDSQLEINGEIFGDLVNDGDNIKVNFGIDLGYVKYRTPEAAMFLSDLKLDFNLSNNLSAKRFEDVSSDLTLTIDRIFAGSDIRDLALNLNLENSSSHIDFSANYDADMTARLIGDIGLAEENIKIVLDTLSLKYKKLALLNEGQIRLSFSDDGYRIENFRLARNGSRLNIKGNLSKEGNQDLVISIDSLKLDDMFVSLFDNTRPEDKLDAVLNMNTHITGSMTKPVIEMDMAVDSITYRGNNFGSLITSVDYNNRNTGLNIRFVEKDKKENALFIEGNVPMEISLAEADTLFKPGPMEVNLLAENFNLGALGDIVPMVSGINGFLSASLNVTGTMDDLEQSGYIALRNVSFLSDINNLKYNLALKVNIDGGTVNLDSLLIQNTNDVPDGGSITGSGSGELEGFSLKSADISIGGRLKVLSENSRYAASPVYGDLVIATRGNVEFRTGEDGMYLNAPVTIKKADLTIPPTQGSYSNTNRNFVYKFVQDTINTAAGRMDFESLITHNQKVSTDISSSAKENTFNYNIDLDVEDEAKIVIVLSNEINQNLTAVLNGSVIYESKEGRPNIQGELKLLEGSTLEFMKTFKAEGSVRFESDISNPFLNIIATYTDYYNPGDSTDDASAEVLVGVKIKIRGPLKDLDKNFIKEEDNIAVYYGEQAIEDDEPDPTKDASDAIMFILTQQFTEDLNQREQSAASSQFAGAATAIAGSVLGGVLNNYFGEYVSDVELRKVGSETKFLFSGRAGAFRYQVGGSQEVFQNLSQANVKIEYPVYLGLTLRFERREDVREGAVINEMVNELGLRYRFEF